LIEINYKRTAELCIGTSEFQSRQKVAEYSWNWLELRASEGASVYWTRRLTIQPIIDARRTERVLAMCCLATSINKINNNNNNKTVLFKDSGDN